MAETFPRPTVRLVGEDGNAFFIVTRVRQALRNAGASKEYIEQFTEEATKGDYDHLLRTVMMYVDID